jgi:hypothetical protein
MNNRRDGRNAGVRPDDLTRNRQYRGDDPSGYMTAPQSNAGYDERGRWTEEAPGNRGEAGGRWHDHEMPYAARGPSHPLERGTATPQATRHGQPEGGFRPAARELWSGGPGGAHGYGHGGREGHDPAAGNASSAAAAARPSFVGKGPRGYRKSDDRIREEVCDHLTAHHEIDASDVDVTVKDGEVVLAGTVDSRATKRMVEDVAGSVGGVHDVLNQLRIRRSEPAAAQAGADERQGNGRRAETPNGATPQRS